MDQGPTEEELIASAKEEEKIFKRVQQMNNPSKEIFIKNVLTNELIQATKSKGDDRQRRLEIIKNMAYEITGMTEKEVDDEFEQVSLVAH